MSFTRHRAWGFMDYVTSSPPQPSSRLTRGGTEAQPWRGWNAEPPLSDSKPSGHDGCHHQGPETAWDVPWGSWNRTMSGISMISQARNYEFLISEFSRTFGSHYLRIGGLDVLGRGPASSYSQAAPRGWPVSPELLWISRGCCPPFGTRRPRSACRSQCYVFVYIYMLY